MKKALSIIIATYNSAAYLERCLSSLKTQMTEEVEVIIIDNESSDTTLQIISKFRGVVTILRSEKDTGIYDAWNKGIMLSSANWILFMGSDDVLHDTTLEFYLNLIKTMGNLLEYDYIAPLINIVDHNGQFVRKFGGPFEWDEFKKNMNLAHVGSLTNKKMFREVGMFDTHYKICGDYELLLRKKDKIKIFFTDKIVADMQIGGVSQANSKAMYEARKAKKKYNLNYNILDELGFIFSLIRFYFRKYYL